MTLVNKILTSKVSKVYNIWRTFIVIFIGVTCFPAQAMEEIVHLQVVNKTKLNSYNEQEKKKAILTRQHAEAEDPEPIQFISEKTKFKWKNKDVEFPQQHSLFLDKIKELKLSTADYNHLCLTLYAIYKEDNDLKVAESRLFARKKVKELSLSDEGLLQKIETVKFYTKINPSNDDKIAYFITHNGGSTAVENDPSIFPISSRSYECTALGCNAVCKELYPHNDMGLCQHPANACRHTDPNALFHIKKHSIKLFAPLIEEAHGVENIKSIGIRFFSYYEPCSKCVKMLHRERSINILGEISFPSSIIFYFNRTYEIPVMKINDDQLQLFNQNNYYLSSGFLKEGLIYFSNDEQENSLGESLGYINLQSQVNLANKDRIFLIQYFKDFNFNNSNQFRIYYY